MKKPSISVIGLGFVGLSLAVVNAKKGFDTVAIEKNNDKLEKISSGNPDFYEPKLKSYLLHAIKAKKITFTDDLNQVLKTDITFLTVGTPPSKKGEIDLSQIKKVTAELARILKKKKSRHLIVIKSTVIPGTTQNIILKKFKNLKIANIVTNPEFLREGNAINDLVNPHLIVIGENTKKGGDFLERYYRIFYKKLPEILRTNLTTAELIKYANNAFLATKISFINSVANLCQNITGADVNTVAYAIGKDSRIGPLFLKAGPGFGGSCLPKDLSAFIKFSEKFKDTDILLKAVKEVNQSQPFRILEIMKQMKVLGERKTISILGLAFKKDTDDIREAVSVKLVRELIKKHLIIKVHDPMAINNFKSIFGNKISYHNTIASCLKNAACCILLTEWDQYQKLEPNDFKINMKTPNIIDARRILEPTKFSKLNFKAIGLGNGVSG